MEKTSKRQAQKLKDDAVSHYNGEEEKVKEIHLRIREVKLMREKENEKKNALELKEREKESDRNENT